ncbi:hypothetical protein [Candidatus Formimonas warabiya]|uniref:Uncharacterized protein n=1 Tax=Formimonas warabiya TaxID=1761012 RepID=A0A3G1KXJ4_FORW1|nr:hypothetical protein [Candidatus Formimonas warabiya]ATW27176.1 hypothetical protein DCMF_22655 [Candidatus Formimonas warabiya]
MVKYPDLSGLFRFFGTKIFDLWKHEIKYFFKETKRRIFSRKKEYIKQSIQVYIRFSLFDQIAMINGRMIYGDKGFRKAAESRL